MVGPPPWRQCEELIDPLLVTSEVSEVSEVEDLVETLGCSEF